MAVIYEDIKLILLIVNKAGCVYSVWCNLLSVLFKHNSSNEYPKISDGYPKIVFVFFIEKITNYEKTVI